MPKITYHHPDGTATPIEVAENTSVMRAALLNNVAGIIGECGGQAMCATCHVFVRSEIDLQWSRDNEDRVRLFVLAAPKVIRALKKQSKTIPRPLMGS